MIDPFFDPICLPLNKGKNLFKKYLSLEEPPPLTKVRVGVGSFTNLIPKKLFKLKIVISKERRDREIYKVF